MRISQPDAIEERRKMIRAADLHYQVMEDMSDDEVEAYVKVVIDAATIVFGTYLDARSPDGVGMHIIKGRRELASGPSDQFLTTAIPCLKLELAIAAEKMFGDGAPEITDTAFARGISRGGGSRNNSPFPKFRAAALETCNGGS